MQLPVSKSLIKCVCNNLMLAKWKKMGKGFPGNIHTLKIDFTFHGIVIHAVVFEWLMESLLAKIQWKGTVLKIWYLKAFF